MTEDERSVVKRALISRALERATALLKVVFSRIERTASDQRGRQSWRNEGAEFNNTQRVVSFLTQSHEILLKKLMLGQSMSQQQTERR